VNDQDVSKSKFLLVIIGEEQYLMELHKIVKSVIKAHSKICYVCLNRPYKEVIDELMSKGIDTAKFFFIDTLSSHYTTEGGNKNCIILQEPIRLLNIREAIRSAIEKEKCSVVLFDTFSTMLAYESNFEIVRFAHNVMTEGRNKGYKIFIVLREENVSKENIRRLAKDLSMFADKTIDFNENTSEINR